LETEEIRGEAFHLVAMRQVDRVRAALIVAKVTFLMSASGG
jgi:hypothetical protein